MQISNNTILITGGATGIGYALAERLLKEGNVVVICGRRPEKLADAKNNLPGLHIINADVSKATGRKDLINWMFENFPLFNVLINNAGVQQFFSLKRENSVVSVKKEIATNFTAPVNLTNLVVPHFMKMKESAVINISSGLGFIPLARFPIYCATKAALHSFSVSSRHQLKDTSVKVFEIIPPIVETELGMNGSGKERRVTGISPTEATEETLKALKGDIYEFPIGTAANLCSAARSERGDMVFNQMNG